MRHNYETYSKKAISQREESEIRANLQSRVEADIKYKKRKENYHAVDFKMMDAGKKFFYTGKSLEEAPLELRSNSDFVHGFEREVRIIENRKEVYDMGVSYWIKGISLTDINKIYLSNPDFMQGYNDAQSVVNNFGLNSDTIRDELCNNEQKKTGKSK